jgi:hypothetical protein
MAWTPEQDEQLRELRGHGFSYGQIGIRIGKTSRMVKSRLENLGIIKRRVWTEVEDNLIVTERGLGKSFADIAQIVGRSESGVLDRYNVLSGRDSFDKTWPPPKDPWAVKINFAEHELKLKPMRTVRVNTDHSQVRSVVGNSSAMCAT